MPWNRRNNVATSTSITPSAPFSDQVVSSLDVTHIMERELHADISKGSRNSEISERNRIDSFRNQSVGVAELEDRILPWFSRQEKHEIDEKILDSESPQPKGSGGIQWSPIEIGHSTNITGTDPLASTGEATGHDDGSIERATLRTWPTIGRRPRHHSMHNSKTHCAATSRSESQSSLSQAISFTPSPSCSGPSSNSGTPGHHYCHCRSFYPYAPYSRGESPRDTNEELLHSPHTFGMPTPPQSRSRSRSRGETQFLKQIPPPLPPLDHPVFREKVDEFGVLSTRQFLFPVTDKVARHAQSLPSITNAKKETHNTGIGYKKSRERSQSSVGVNTQGNQYNPRAEFMRKAFHSRTSSKTSIASSRRSSAEYSAKQASSLGHNGSWEVDVSKAIISLSLQEQQVGSTRSLTSGGLAGTAPGLIAFPGQACGYNKPSREQRIGLGSPFFLQSPLPRNLISNSVSNDRGKTVKSKYRIREPEIENVARDGRIKMMDSDKGPVTPITISSSNPTTSGNPKQASGSAAPSLDKAPSRRTGSRLSGSRSGTKTSPLRRGEKAGDSSFLHVPQLTVIGPTPEASPVSPITPTRRVHHKSTPTMPPKSILPPVIEKSYSSGSVKRKAEADVEGDKTPPKETKEHEAIAPDTRTNRLSIGHAPSSFHRSKRVRLTDTSEGGRSTVSRMSHPGSVEDPPSAKTTGSWSSRGSHGPRSASYLFSREGPPLARSASHVSHSHSVRSHLAPSRKSLSQVSIPISALVSPHAPSVANSRAYHMRDPRKPPPLQSTRWTLSFPDRQAGESRWTLHSWVERGGSPRHAWLFFIGFIVFPLWWVAAFLPIPRTRRIGDTDAEKGVTLDDPQVEHDAKSWRFRCRVMALMSLITYVPFIVLVAILTHH